MSEHQQQQRSSLTAGEIALGRAKKKIERLKKQRDHWQERCTHYRKVLDLHPTAEWRYKQYQDYLKQRQHVKALEDRVKEQALLIQKLTNA